ncbi:DUF5060 domain-containing protein [Oenococcus oeni]
MNNCERWKVYELAINGPTNGNPFIDVHFSETFSFGKKSIHVRGFYDGDGKYKLRSMPEFVGKWLLVTKSNTKRRF